MQVVAGARSALFLPFANPGLIVVDEAHEISFKQEDGVRYHARDVAVMRGKFEGFPVVLASATPALESRHMVAIGRYKGLAIPSRFGAAKLPEDRGNRPDAGPARARHMDRADLCLRRWRNGLNGASKACCSSTAAAMRR